MARNQIKTVLLLGSLTGLVLLIGGWWGGRSGLLIGLVLALAINFASYWWSDRIILWTYGAKVADKKQYIHLYTLVEEIRDKARLPMPKVHIINSPQSNAFATGRSPQKAAVAVTTGILQLLDDRELKGVLAHEMGHIQNRDILISTITAALAGVISYLALTVRWAALFGGMGSQDGERGINPLELIVLAILAPLMALIIQSAISRSREYLADETGAKLIRDPLSLASALQKIEKSVSVHPFPMMGKTEATAHLFIHNPFRGKSFLNLFSTHPPTGERVSRLKALKI